MPLPYRPRREDSLSSPGWLGRRIGLQFWIGASIVWSLMANVKIYRFQEVSSVPTPHGKNEDPIVDPLHFLPPSLAAAAAAALTMDILSIASLSRIEYVQTQQRNALGRTIPQSETFFMSRKIWTIPLRHAGTCRWRWR